MRTARRSTSTGCWRSASPPRRPPRAPAVTAVIAAAGSGERLGAGGPKAFVPLAGKPMVQWSVDAFRACAAVSAIVVAAPPGQEKRLGGGEEGGGDAGEPQLTVVAGGATRAESVANALAAVETELVAIHDAARPLLTPELLDALVADLDAVPEAAGVIPAAPVSDTVKRVAEGTRTALTTLEGANAVLVVQGTEDRTRLWAAQTPQVFRAAALREALAGDAEGQAAATDEAMLVEAAGGTVLIHPCGPENLKVTTPLDLRIAEMLLAERAAAGP